MPSINMSIADQFEMFPEEESACKWMEEIRWPDGKRHCLLCY